MRHD
jgi:universal stress protein A